MSDGYVSKETSDILARIDLSLTDSELMDGAINLFHDAKKQLCFLESEIAQLKKACAEWSEVSQHNYQRAKTASLALEAIKAVVKATSNGETE